jgi:hypothetical protein
VSAGGTLSEKMEEWNGGTLEYWVKTEYGLPIIPTIHYSSIPISRWLFSVRLLKIKQNISSLSLL